MGGQRRTRTITALALATLLSALLCWGHATGATTPVFINELHYDNDSTDEGEAVEIAGPAGTDLSGWTIVLYNGNGGPTYGTISLSGTLSDQQNGFGMMSFDAPGLQNGAPDGLALTNSGNSVVQFLSYEGGFVGSGGPADGMTSQDIGVQETSNTPTEFSLQLIGTGSVYEDFVWSGPISWTFGDVNEGQNFEASTHPVPEPGTGLLLAFGLFGMARAVRRRRKD